MNSAAWRAADDGTQPGPGRYALVMIVFGNAASSTAAVILVISCTRMGLVSVASVFSSIWEQNVTVCDHWAAARAETGLIDSNRRLAAGRPVCSAANSAAADQG